jgi:hypothetical protein
MPDCDDLAKTLISDDGNVATIASTVELRRPKAIPTHDI